MNRFPCKGLRKCLSTGLSAFALILLQSGSLDTALAADDPPATTARSSQVDSLEIPGSFKDLPEARDAVTAKRSTEKITPVTQTGPASVELVIDVVKVARTGGTVNSGAAYGGSPYDGPAYAESELVDFHATAYCLKGRTASGINTRPGVIAADPRVLPLGTVVHLRAGRYTGTYTVMDTGGRIKGRLVDVYVPTYREAMEFGRRQVKIKVIGRNSTKGARKSVLAAGL